MKPTEQQVREWIAQIKSDSGEAYTQDLCELAAQWGASQAQQTTADAGRVLEWMRTPNRKPANLAFTDGPERQAAYWIEIAQQRVAQQTTEPELPEPEAIRHSFDGYGWMYIDNGHGSGWRSGIDKADAEFMYTAAQMHDHFAAGVRSGMAQSQDAKLEPLVREALRKAFSFGQRYWQQADSEYASHHKKSDETQRKFLALIEETIAAMQGGKQ